MAICVRRTTRFTDAEVWQLTAIYLESFPAEERSDFGELIQDISTEKRVMHVASEHRDALGFGILLPLVHRLYLLEYLAVEASRRSKGIGGALLDAAGAFVAAHEGTGMLIEVQHEESPFGDDERTKRRRISFYERHGAVSVPGAPAYSPPSMIDGTPLLTRLLWLPAAPDADVPAGEELATAIHNLLRMSYGLDPGDPLVETNLRALI